MRHIVVAIALCACGSKDDGKAAKASTADLEADWKAARKAVKPGDAWDAAVAEMAKKLGLPGVKRDGEHVWALVDGGDCYDTRLTRKDDKVNGVMGGKVSSIVEDRFAKCKADAEAR